MGRLITEKQEQIFRTCHHYFGGLTQAETAEKLNMSQSAISDALKQVEKVMPQFFPILTKLEVQCYHFYCAEGWSVDEIAEHFGLTPNSVYKTLKRTKDKGMCFNEPKGRVLRYDPSMDAEIKQQF